MDDTFPRLVALFRRVFEDDALVISAATTAADLRAWDSVMHITLLMECEDAFGIEFPPGDVAGLKNVGALVAVIDRLRR